MRFVITAGPTREYLDDVRYLSNASSGRMGYAIARAGVRAGHRVTLVSGPVDLPAPRGVRLVRVTSTQEMYRATAAAFRQGDCLIGAAAAADYMPAQRVRGKIKKQPRGLTLRLMLTTDILATLGRRKGKRIIIAFALEAQNAEANALGKLRVKNADAIALNRPAAIAAARSSVTIILRTGERMELRNAPKSRTAGALIQLAERLHAARC